MCAQEVDDALRAATSALVDTRLHVPNANWLPASQAADAALAAAFGHVAARVQRQLRSSSGRVLLVKDLTTVVVDKSETGAGQGAAAAPTLEARLQDWIEKLHEEVKAQKEVRV